MWRELRIVIPRGAAASASSCLFSLGAQGVQEDFLPGEAPAPRQPWDTGPPPPAPARLVLVGWFEDPDEADVLAHLPPETLAAAWDDVPEVDWENSWKAAFGPVKISDTLTIAPPWDAPAGALLIEPGQGFGTGLHPSTQAALRLMEPCFVSSATCLDVGSGSGILAIAAARAGLIARGIDVEPAAVRDAQHNAARNGLEVEFDTTPLRDLTGTWDLVAANLHAELIQELGPELARVCGRWLVTAGVLLERETTATAALRPWFRLVTREEAEGAWVAHTWERVG